MTPPPPVVADANRSGLHALVLAAGASRRFGSPKQLALIDGVPMLQRVIETLREALCLEVDCQDDSATLPLTKPPITIVLGAHAPAIRAAIGFNDARVIECADWDSGMAHSLRCGLTEMARRSEGAPANETQSATSAALVMLGDTPFLTASDLQRLIVAWQAAPDVPAASQYAGTIGAPCILPRAVWPEIEALEGDHGAGAWLKARRAANGILTLVAMPMAAHDVDRPRLMD